MGSLAWTIDDTSPLWQYAPYGDYFAGNSTARGAGMRSGWQAWYSGAGFEKNTGGGQSVLGAGTSYHLSSLPRANATLSFYGSGITIRGFSNASYAVLIDGVHVSGGALVSNHSGFLYSTHSLPNGPHNATLLVTSDGRENNTFLALDGASVAWETPSSPEPPAPVVVDNQNMTALAYQGLWNHAFVDPLIHNERPTSVTTEYGASVSCSFSNALAVGINGTSNYGGWTYTVELDEEVVGTYNASGAWFVPDTQLFFMAGLDPARTYNLTLKNDGASPWLKLWFTSLTLFQLPRDSSNAGAPAAPAASTGTSHVRHLSAGARAAAIALPLIFLLLSALTTVLFVRRRRRQSMAMEAVPDHVPDVYHGVEPARFAALRSSKREMMAADPAFSGLPVLASSPRGPASASDAAPGVDVDRLVELIAQRIDLPGEPGNTSPPQYQDPREN